MKGRAPSGGIADWRTRYTLRALAPASPLRHPEESNPGPYAVGVCQTMRDKTARLEVNTGVRVVFPTVSVVGLLNCLVRDRTYYTTRPTAVVSEISLTGS